MPDTQIQRITPTEAKDLLAQDPAAILVDVRSKVEFDYVGHPIGAVHVAWKEYPDWVENPDFAAHLDAMLATDGESAKDRPIVVICRSGVRSLNAGECLRAHGYTKVYNVEEGFEGDKDNDRHRGNINGWRFRGLPWEQG